MEGSQAPCPADLKELPSYRSGAIDAVSDEEFARLLGHAVPDGSWGNRLDANDAICQLYYAKSRMARWIYRILNHRLDKSMAKGEPDLNLLFIYNMPFRGIGKMTGGLVSQYMVDGLVRAANGHFFGGLGQVLSGFFRQRKTAKKAEKMK
ncbi:MAG: hypothetical protein LUF34_04375 [Lachnospiraceae bacterium]|nr:hypothetical protein [Lachnospiraceae bacterium]